MTVRSAGLVRQRFSDVAVKTFLAKVDVISRLAALLADTGHTVLFGVFYQGVAEFQILCYTVHVT